MSAKTRKAVLQFREQSGNTHDVVNIYGEKNVPTSDRKNSERQRTLEHLENKVGVALADIEQILNSEIKDDQKRNDLLTARDKYAAVQRVVDSIRNALKRDPKKHLLAAAIEMADEAELLAFEIILEHVTKEKWPNRLFIGGDGKVILDTKVKPD